MFQLGKTIPLLLLIASRTSPIQLGHELTQYTSKLTWNDAACVCRMTGRHLMMMKTSSDRTVIEYLINKPPWNTLLSTELWLGLYDAGHGQPPVLYTWHDGHTLGTFAPWYIYYSPIEPNNQRHDFCVLADYTTPSTQKTPRLWWKSNNCAEMHSFVCERTIDCWMETTKGATLVVWNTTSTTTITTHRNGVTVAMCENFCLNAEKDGYRCWAVTFESETGFCQAYLSENRFAVKEKNHSKKSRKTGSLLMLLKCFDVSLNTSLIIFDDLSTVPKPDCVNATTLPLTTTTFSTSQTSVLTTATTTTAAATEPSPSNIPVTSDETQTGNLLTSSDGNIVLTSVSPQPSSDTPQPTDSPQPSGSPQFSDKSVSSASPQVSTTSQLNGTGVTTKSLTTSSTSGGTANSKDTNQASSGGTLPVTNKPLPIDDWVTEAPTATSTETVSSASEFGSHVTAVDQITSESTFTTQATSNGQTTTTSNVDGTPLSNDKSGAGNSDPSKNGGTSTLTSTTKSILKNQDMTVDPDDEAQSPSSKTSLTSTSSSNLNNSTMNASTGASPLSTSSVDVNSSVLGGSATEASTVTTESTKQKSTLTTPVDNFTSDDNSTQASNGNSTQQIVDSANRTTEITTSTTDVVTSNTTSVTSHSSTVPAASSTDGSTKCQCVCVVNKTREQQQDYVKQIVQKLVVFRNATSAFKRKFTTASDPRTSAAAVGGIGIAILIIFLLVFVVLDLQKFADIVIGIFKTDHGKGKEAVPDLISTSEIHTGNYQREKPFDRQGEKPLSHQSEKPLNHRRETPVNPPLRRPSIAQIPPAGALPVSNPIRGGILPPLQRLTSKSEIEQPKPKPRAKFRVINRQGPNVNFARLRGPSEIPDIILQRHSQAKTSKHNTVGPAP
ncbi:serine-rich adhesin for platelets-like [Gigantopelta aegis]|uniref:serine-rich adhesin for platelets-like n=1 Tax=Gigantopelta aegis TaxID=1735272 RepID=UPI001B888476|nr:serine-rich adhesin for platelets-like [Gigantopelta aegis]